VIDENAAMDGREVTATDLALHVVIAVAEG
jgi:hypothetical protein